MVTAAAIDVAANLAAVRRRIAAAAADRDGVTLVAVGKGHGPERAVAALGAGQRVFGENRVQEAERKWPPLKAAYPDVSLHLIGPLQSNKLRPAVALFDVIETVDRAKIARGLAAEFARVGEARDCFIQINSGGEKQKSGVLPAAADAFIEECIGPLELPVVGLMCIPPIDEEAALHFALLAKIARRHGLRQLSMGMSGDYETAIRFGATHVRVGSAIFGPRS